MGRARGRGPRYSISELWTRLCRACYWLRQALRGRRRMVRFGADGGGRGAGGLLGGRAPGRARLPHPYVLRFSKRGLVAVEMVAAGAHNGNGVGLGSGVGIEDEQAAAEERAHRTHKLCHRTLHMHACAAYGAGGRPSSADNPSRAIANCGGGCAAVGVGVGAVAGAVAGADACESQSRSSRVPLARIQLHLAAGDRHNGVLPRESSGDAIHSRATV